MAEIGDPLTTPVEIPEKAPRTVPVPEKPERKKEPVPG